MESVRKRILIIEDDEVISQVFADYLDMLGYQVTQAEDGKLGLDAFFEERPDLIISDLRMPVMGGMEVAKMVQAMAPDVPVILASGTGDVKEVVNSLKHGAWDYIEKPVQNLEVIQHAVERALERAQLIMENRKYREHLEEEIKKRTREFEEELAARKKTENLLNDSLATLQKLTDSTIVTIAKIGELRDPYMSGHMRRVAQLARRIAQELGMDEEQVKSIYVASLLHDIGKISVPLDILCKPGKISPLEKEIINTHTTTGAHILEGIETKWEISKIVCQHHEKMDGSGYPYGCKGNEILPEARIIAVADVVEAIAAHRPALGMGAALAEITQNSGILYDSQVAEICCRLIIAGFAFEQNF